MIRRAAAEDFAAFAAIWSEAFGDGEAFSSMVFDKFAGPGCVFAAEEAGEVLAILCAVPCTLKEKKGAYLYGLATAEKARGQGLMTALLAGAEKTLAAEGAAFTALVPASASLFDFYAQRGFVKAFGLRELQRPIQYNIWARADFDSCTAGQLLQLRRRYCPDALLFDNRRMVEILLDLYREGVTVASRADGYCLFFHKGNEIVVPEIFAEGERAAEQLLEAARQKIGAETARITVGEGSTLFLGEGAKRDYGMIHALAGPLDTFECYMRLVMDT